MRLWRGKEKEKGEEEGGREEEEEGGRRSGEEEGEKEGEEWRWRGEENNL